MLNCKMKTIINTKKKKQILRLNILLGETSALVTNFKNKIDN